MTGPVFDDDAIYSIIDHDELKQIIANLIQPECKTDLKPSDFVLYTSERTIMEIMRVLLYKLLDPCCSFLVSMLGLYVEPVILSLNYQANVY